jgi:hypothetical protein
MTPSMDIWQLPVLTDSEGVAAELTPKILVEPMVVQV